MDDTSPLLAQLTEEAEEASSPGEALDAWRRALVHYTTPYLLYRFGRQALELEEWTEAEQALLRAIELAPGFALPYISLGYLCLEQGDALRAQEYLAKALEIDRSPPAHTLLGVAQKRLGMTTEASESFHCAIQIDPNYEEAYYNLAIMCDDTSEAIGLFQKALDLDPDYQKAHRELGWAYRRQERLKEAERHIRRAIELDVTDGWSYIYLGNIEWLRGQIVEAEDLFKQAIHVWPDTSLTYWCLAIFYEYQGRTAEADFFYEKALEVDPDDPESNLRLGLLLKDNEQVEKSRHYLERALSLDPADERAKIALDELY